MYQPTLGRFLSRDPLSADGVDVLLSNGWFDEQMTEMRNQYGYVSNSPVNYVDPNGMRQQPTKAPTGPAAAAPGTCMIGVHCGSVWLGGVIPTLNMHCGFTITDATGATYLLDGAAIDHWPIDRLLIKLLYEPSGFVWDFPAKQKSFPSSVCACLLSYALKFTAAKKTYDPFCGNSNWALRCMVDNCGLKLTFNSFDPPLGYDCQECVQWGMPIGPVGCGAPCIKTALKKCP